MMSFRGILAGVARGGHAEGHDCVGSGQPVYKSAERL